MKFLSSFFVAAVTSLASRALGQATLFEIDGTFDANWDIANGGTSGLSLTYELNGEASGLFYVELTDCSNTGGYTMSPANGDTAPGTLPGTITFTNTAEVVNVEYCVAVELKLDSTSFTDYVIATRTFKNTVTADGTGGYTADSSSLGSTVQQNTQNPVTTVDMEDRDASFTITVNSPIKYDETVTVTINGVAPADSWSWAITSVTGDLADPNDAMESPAYTPGTGSSTATFKLPFAYFQASTVTLTVSANWAVPSRRELRGLQEDEPTSGEINEEITVNLDTSSVPPELMGTSAAAEYHTYSIVGTCLAVGAAVAAI